MCAHTGLHTSYSSHCQDLTKRPRAWRCDPNDDERAVCHQHHGRGQCLHGATARRITTHTHTHTPMLPERWRARLGVGGRPLLGQASRNVSATPVNGQIRARSARVRAKFHTGGSRAGPRSTSYNDRLETPADTPQATPYGGRRPEYQEQPQMSLMGNAPLRLGVWPCLESHTKSSAPLLQGESGGIPLKKVDGPKENNIGKGNGRDPLTHGRRDREEERYAPTGSHQALRDRARPACRTTARTHCSPTN